MPTFTAKTKEVYPIEPPKPGEEVPSADQGGVMYSPGDNKHGVMRKTYFHPKHTLKDMQRPGYFPQTDDGWGLQLSVGDEIRYTLGCGSNDPADHERGWCVVLEKPSDKDLPIILGGFCEYPRATPWRG